MIWNIVVVGSGGTGSAMLQKLARYQRNCIEDIRVCLIDGDEVEKKNLKRQNFFDDNIGQNKAEALAELASSSYGVVWDAYNQYITKVEQLNGVFERYANNSSINILIGCVDNHRARQVMEGWFDLQENCIYIDSANDEHDGEIVIAIKTDGVEVSPRRSHYFPDVLTDDSPSVVEMSCEQRNISSPQHQLVNDLAGNIIMSIICNVFSRKIPTGMIIFDVFDYRIRHMSYVNGVLEAPT